VIECMLSLCKVLDLILTIKGKKIGGTSIFPNRIHQNCVPYIPYTIRVLRDRGGTAVLDL
jgi:hypothetical protein